MDEGMAVVEKFDARRVKHRAFLITIKYLPHLIMLLDWANTFLCIYGKQYVAISYIGGTSYLVLLFMLLTSYAFEFCSYHRVPIYYIFINNSLVLYDYYIGLPIDNKGMLDLNITLIGATVIIMTALYIKESRRFRNEKVTRGS